MDDQKSISSDLAIIPSNHVVDFNPIYSTAVKPLINDKRGTFFEVNSKLRAAPPPDDIYEKEAITPGPPSVDDIHSLPGIEAFQKSAEDDQYSNTTASQNRTVVSVTSVPELDRQLSESLEDESMFVTTIVLPP